jgi:trk system potassium uptake protein TrkA
MHAVGRYLADMAEGQNIIELSDILRGDARMFSFEIRREDECTLKEFSLPGDARVVCYYRNGDEFRFADEKTRLSAGDQVVVLTRARHLPQLRERFH